MVICVRKCNHLKYKPIMKIVRNYSRYNHDNLVEELKSFYVKMT